MKLTHFILMAMTMAPIWSIHPHHGRVIPLCRKKSNAWKNLTVTSSGTTDMKHGSGGAAITSNKQVENLLLQNKHNHSQINHHKKTEKSRIVGREVTSIETSGNSVTDIGAPSLLGKVHGHHHHHHRRRGCGCGGPWWGYSNGAYPAYWNGYAGASANAAAAASAGANAWGPGGSASARAKAKAKSAAWGYGPYGGASSSAKASAKAKSRSAGWGPYGGYWGASSSAKAHAHAHARSHSHGYGYGYAPGYPVVAIGGSK